MRRTNLRRLEALENQQRCREQKEQDALQRASFCIWEIVLAYYLGELDSDKELLALKLRDRLGEAFARALKYELKDEYRDVLFRKCGSTREDWSARCGERFFVERLRSLSLDRRKTMIDPGHPRLSIVRQCELASISRSLC